VRQRQAEALGLERRLADLVNQAYGLTPEDVELLWRTVPPQSVCVTISAVSASASCASSW